MGVPSLGVPWEEGDGRRSEAVPSTESEAWRSKGSGLLCVTSTATLLEGRLSPLKSPKSPPEKIFGGMRLITLLSYDSE